MRFGLGLAFWEVKELGAGHAHVDVLHPHFYLRHAIRCFRALGTRPLLLPPAHPPQPPAPLQTNRQMFLETVTPLKYGVPSRFQVLRRGPRIKKLFKTRPKTTVSKWNQRSNVYCATDHKFNRRTLKLFGEENWRTTLEVSQHKTLISRYGFQSNSKVVFSNDDCRQAMHLKKN